MQSGTDLETLGGAASPTALAEGQHAEDVAAPRRESQGSVSQAAGSSLDIALYTIGFALFTGLVESGYWVLKRECFGELIHMSRSVYWMTPVAQVFTLLAPGLVLALLARRLRHPAMLAFSVTLVSFLGWLNVVFLFPKIHLLASLLLTGGLAAATGRLFERFGHRSRRVTRCAVPLLLLSVVGIAGFTEAGRWREENRTTAAVTSATKQRPNVLLLVLDTVRADALGLYGADRSLSPQLDHWAKQGVVFDQAVATAPWTLPSHAGFFTSRLPHELSGDWATPLDDEHPTLAEWLGRQGYATAGFVANTRYCSSETGLARGFEHYEDFGFTAADFALSTALGRRFLLGTLPLKLGFTDWPGRKPAEAINASFLDWLSQQKDRPYFAFLNYWDAHDPYVPRPPFEDDFAPSLEQRLMLRNWWWIDKQKLSEQQVAFARRAYDDCIRALDYHVGRLLEALKTEGRLDNTVVIITSDHGEHFGEHGLFTHGNSLYQPVLHVPLVILAPNRVPENERVSHPVSLRDLPATVCELAGVAEGHPFLGDSLSRWWKLPHGGQTQVDSSVISEIATPAKFPPDHGRSPVAGGALSSIISHGMKFIRSTDGTEELYDLEGDPTELQDLAENETKLPTLTKLRTMLREAVDQEHPPEER